MRIGHGYDVHKLVRGKHLVLGGVEIEHTKGLLGHSDADVLLHAISDALLGAAGLGDIGRHFPDSDERYKGISSMLLLKEVVCKLKENGYSISNIDATIIAQKPKIAPYVEKMVGNISSACEISSDQVNVKATTEEGLGFTGIEQGISSHAVCIIYKSKSEG